MKAYESRSVLRRLPVDHIEEIEEESHVGHLARSLGLWQLTAIGVGGIIGVGIFSLAGLVAHGDADNPGVGPSVVIAFLIAGLASAGRFVLRRVRRHDPESRLGVHVRLRRAG